MKVELFSAGCKLCDATLEFLNNNFPKLELVVHLVSDCVDGSCCQLAAKYDIRAVPSIVVDGKVVQVGIPSLADKERLNDILLA